jgi:putative transcriptional regulator
MTILHHPSDETLAAFASGTLDARRAVVVATHVCLCPRCANAMRAFEHIGGAMLEAAAPAGMSAGAWERAAAELDRVAPSAALAVPDVAMPGAAALMAAPAQKQEPSDELPPTLRPYALGRWRHVGGGLLTRPVQVHSDSDVRVFLLKGGPGTRLLQHRHTGTEWTCVIHGAYRDEHRRYGPGDFDESDESIEHYQVVEEGRPCVAVVAMQGDIKLQGFIGWLLRPFIRI